jgi:hypothetical protein
MALARKRRCAAVPPAAPARADLLRPAEGCAAQGRAIGRGVAMFPCGYVALQPQTLNETLARHRAQPNRLAGGRRHLALLRIRDAVQARAACMRIHAPPNLKGSHVFLRKTGSQFCATCSGVPNRCKPPLGLFCVAQFSGTVPHIPPPVRQPAPPPSPMTRPIGNYSRPASLSHPPPRQ